MRWWLPWRRRKRADDSVDNATKQAKASTEIAAAATEQALHHLSQLQALRPVVEGTAADHQELRRVNHFSDMFTQALRGHRRGAPDR